MLHQRTTTKIVLIENFGSEKVLDVLFGEVCTLLHYFHEEVYILLVQELNEVLRPVNEQAVKAEQANFLID